MDPPRPLEPRAQHERTPSLQAPVRFEGYPPLPSSAPHQHVQTLPGVKDILSPPQAGYTGAESWRGPQQFHPDPRYQQEPTYPSRDTYSQQERRIELPILETRHQPVGLAPSPFGTSPYIDSAATRPRQSSGSSYARDSVSSPYAPSHDDAQARVPNGYERQPSVIFTPTSADSSRRYVGIQDFPDGQFHVYDDGHKIPTQIEGEQVNPQWGLTKANKPRKRLALACMDCREKKIKCEPGATSCVQCEKAKRVCRRYDHEIVRDLLITDMLRRNTNHSQQDNSSVTEWSSSAGSPPAVRPGTTASMPPVSRENDIDLLQKRRAQDDLIAQHETIKRQKSVSPSAMINALHPIPNGHAPMPSRPRAYSEDENPFAINPDLTMHLLSLYFQHINSGVYNLIPQEQFMQWVTSNTEQSQTDRAVLHAMLAMASIFDHNCEAAGQHCADLAVASLNKKFGRFSLQLIHVRLILALYTFAKNNKGMAWEHSGAAMRAISAGRFNNEENCIASTEQLYSDGRYKEYGMQLQQAIECRRRTFWCGFMMDRFYGFCEGMLCTVDKADVYLRLPCSDSIFVKSARSTAPFFDNGIVERADTVLTPSAPVSNMAHMALIVSIWGDVMNFINRGTHRGSAGHAEAYEAFYAETYPALQAWRSHLPSHLQYNEQNVLNSVRGRYAGEFVSMHVLHEAALLKLNRCMRWSLNKDKVPRNIREAHRHANTIFEIITALNNTRNEPSISPDAHAHRFSFSTPFIGFAIVSAIDVISAGGHDDRLRTTINLMREGLAFLRELQGCWQSAADQSRDGEKRFFQVSNIVSRPFKAASGCWLGRSWGLETALETEIDPKDDCIYGVEGTEYYAAMNQKPNGR